MMDGLSAAASGMAVVSLTVQLVDSVREIRRFFRTLKDAPEELDRLIDLLENMELMLENIGKLIDPDCDISPSVLKAIQTCDKALSKLDALIQKVKRNASAQNPLKQSLAFFKLACKKQDVEEIEKQLDRAVSNLNMVMTALNLHGIQRLWTGVSATNAAAATITEVVLRMEDAVNQKGLKQKLTSENRSQTPSYAISRRSATHKVIYQGFLGTITARTQSQTVGFVEKEDSKEFNTRDEWSWVLIPSFLSQCVQVQCVRSFGSVERTLRTFPILPDDHPAWKMSMDGEVASIQELFSTREISPYVVSRYGQTLLHCASTWYRAEMCHLLLDIGVGTDVIDTYGELATGGPVGSETCDEIESTYRSFTTADYDKDLAYFCPEYFCPFECLSVEEFRFRVEMWVTEENVNLFSPSPLQVIVKRLCDLSIESIELHKWIDIAAYLIAKEADFRKIKSFGQETCLLEVLVTSTVHPFDAQTVGTRFLEMLDAANIDLAEYLNLERQHHPAGLLTLKVPGLIIDSVHDSRPVKLYINEEQPFSLSWDWWVDAEGTASLVLDEFQHFGRAEESLGFRSDPNIVHLDYWPFVYPKWAVGIVYYEDAVLVEERYDNRWQKKMIKQAKMQGTYQKPKIQGTHYQEPKMPGTWIN